MSASFGFVFGALFPLVSTMIVLVSRDLYPTWATVALVHRTEPLLQVIDAMPLILMLAFGLVGRGRAELAELIAGLEGRVIQRTAVLTAARESAEQEEQKRSLLLARVSHSMCERIEKIVRTPQAERSPWAWESVMDIAKRLRDLSRFEAGQIPQSTETFEPKILVEGVRALAVGSQMTQSNVVCTLDPGVPTSIEGNPELFSATLELAVQLTAGLAVGGTTSVAILPQRGAPGSTDRIHIQCKNDGARGSSASLSRILRDDEGASDTDAIRELIGVTLRTYASALDAEMAIRTDPDDGTVVSLLIPVVVATPIKPAEPAPSSVSDEDLPMEASPVSAA